MPAEVPAFELRSAQASDREFLFALHRATMRDVIERTWGSWDEPWQRAHFEARFAPSGTSRWVAVYRARETERPDALFRDPHARKLAGERGEEIERLLSGGKDLQSWSFVTRTVVFDRLVAEQVRKGADLVVNLAAGLDTRPYRMALPSSLRWIAVDLPEP